MTQLYYAANNYSQAKAIRVTDQASFEQKLKAYQTVIAFAKKGIAEDTSDTKNCIEHICSSKQNMAAIVIDAIQEHRDYLSKSVIDSAKEVDALLASILTETHDGNQYIDIAKDVVKKEDIENAQKLLKAGLTDIQVADSTDQGQLSAALTDLKEVQDNFDLGEASKDACQNFLFLAQNLEFGKAKMDALTQAYTLLQPGKFVLDMKAPMDITLVRNLTLSLGLSALVRKNHALVKEMKDLYDTYLPDQQFYTQIDSAAEKCRENFKADKAANSNQGKIGMTALLELQQEAPQLVKAALGDLQAAHPAQSTDASLNPNILFVAADFDLHALGLDLDMSFLS